MFNKKFHENPFVNRNKLVHKFS